MYGDGKVNFVVIGVLNLRYVRVDRCHDVHAGRGNVGLCLCTNLNAACKDEY